MAIDIQVSLHVQGRDLDPDQVTKLLGVRPHTMFRRGDTKTYRSERVHVRKEGYWAYGERGTDFDAVVNAFITELGEHRQIMGILTGVEQACIEIRMLKRPDDEEDDYHEIVFAPAQQKALSDYGVQLRVSVIMSRGDSGSEPTDGYAVNPWTGDVIDPNGEWIGNLGDVQD